MKRYWAYLFVVLLQTGVSVVHAQVVGSGFLNPVFATTAPGTPGTMYVVQQGGLVRPLNLQTGAIGLTALLDMSSISGSNFISGGERGLLGLAFHPDYATNKQIYVQYTYNNGQAGGALRVDQFTVGATGTVNASSRQTVIDYDDRSFNNHNAGWIGFNPKATGTAANNLYITTGDGGSGNDPGSNAQNLNVYTGKLLRVNVGNGITANGGYRVPTGNMSGAGVKPEIYSYGLRNPFRASFDRGTGDLYIGDVGQGAREEVNFIANGANGGQNFGWRVREGKIQNPNFPNDPVPANAIDPIFDYTHSVGQSITGGYVYRGAAVDQAGNALDGTYFFGDYVSGRIWSFKYIDNTATAFTDRTAEFGFSTNPINVSSFAEDGLGALYVIDYNGTIIRIVPVPEPASIGLVLGAIGLLAAGWRRYRANRG
jgi:glucose/arabinose dehydrogenase